MPLLPDPVTVLLFSRTPESGAPPQSRMAIPEECALVIVLLAIVVFVRSQAKMAEFLLGSTAVFEMVVPVTEYPPPPKMLRPEVELVIVLYPKLTGPTAPPTNGG